VDAIYDKLKENPNYKPAAVPILTQTLESYDDSVSASIFPALRVNVPLSLEHIHTALARSSEALAKRIGVNPNFEAVPDVALSQDARDLIDLVREISGRRVVFFMSDIIPNTHFNGFIKSDDTQYVFLNVRNVGGKL